MAFKGTIIKKMTIGDYFYPFGKWPMVEKFTSLKGFRSLPGGEFTGESISKMNNSTYILYTLKLLMKKTRHIA
jgi:hypothetical protein